MPNTFVFLFRPLSLHQHSKRLPSKTVVKREKKTEKRKSTTSITKHAEKHHEYFDDNKIHPEHCTYSYTNNTYTWYMFPHSSATVAVRANNNNHNEKLFTINLLTFARSLPFTFVHIKCEMFMLFSYPASLIVKPSELSWTALFFFFLLH